MRSEEPQKLPLGKRGWREDLPGDGAMKYQLLNPFVDEPHGLVTVVIETPAGSQNKFDYNSEIDGFVLDRPIHSSLRYPFDYGFVPNTLARDGDPVDAVVIIAQPTFPGCIVRARVIGVMDMEDEAGDDEKIICTSLKDPRSAHITDIMQIAPHHLREMEHFFIHIKDLENEKWAKVHGFRGRAEALNVVKAGVLGAQP
jgi:inorganic pyrophosphatase